MHTSASALIKEERALPSWDSDKRVADVDMNQVALAQAVTRRNVDGQALLLDGHFVLLGQDGQFIPLGVEVFKALKLRAVVLIEAPTDVVAGRIAKRDELHRDLTWLSDFMLKEKSQAELVCTALSLPLTVLTAPSDVEFANAVGCC